MVNHRPLAALGDVRRRAVTETGEGVESRPLARARRWTGCSCGEDALRLEGEAAVDGAIGTRMERARPPLITNSLQDPTESNQEQPTPPTDEDFE